jgi:eukaryotic translation initiation factor 2-alpha kinase 4
LGGVKEVSTTGTSPSSRLKSSVDDNQNQAMIERELLRQREALEAARIRRREVKTGNDAILNRSGIPVASVPATMLDNGVDESQEISSDNDDDIFWDHNNSGDAGLEMTAGAMNASRYLSDFVEIGILGRGGGGEVVKVKNRLDRRIYAVKKILLEPERGRLGKVAALHNRKLRREVTTISRMTHINIVRYYQAWVEGSMESTPVDAIAEEDNSQEKDNDERSQDRSSESSSDSDDEAVSDGSNAWWDMQGTRLMEQDSESEDSLFDHGDDNEKRAASRVSALCGGRRAQSASAVNLLEHELDVGMNSPLLSGLGFNYHGMHGTKRDLASNVEANEDDDSSWDESSVQVDSRSGKMILYIQMEYCATTLRKLIDDRAILEMTENDKWRLVRQILEALAYLHSRNVIHR